MKELSSSTIIIEGGNRLEGRIEAQGDKTVAVHLLFCLIFCPDTEFTFSRFPRCADVMSVLNWIRSTLSCQIHLNGNFLTYKGFHIPNISDIREINFIRSSICLLVPLTVIGKKLTFEKVGGCNFAERPINRHLDLASAFGIEVIEQDNCFEATLMKAKKNIIFDCSVLSIPSVGVTCHALISALVFEGEIFLKNISIEPSIISILNILEKKRYVSYDLKRREIYIAIGKREKLTFYKKSITPDITAILTYAAAVLVTKGSIEIESDLQLPESICTLLGKLNVAYKKINSGGSFSSKKLLAPGHVVCMPSPGIPTDCGPVLSALFSNINGRCSVQDSVYNYRDSHILPLQNMGYNINFHVNTTFTYGQDPNVEELSVIASDIRAGAAMVIGALSRDTKTTIHNFEQIERGYSDILSNLRSLGAKIKYA